MRLVPARSTRSRSDGKNSTLDRLKHFRLVPTLVMSANIATAYFSMQTCLYIADLSDCWHSSSKNIAFMTQQRIATQCNHFVLLTMYVGKDVVIKMTTNAI